ncbi:MAG: phosphatase PAP2 family protein, partial [Anaerolineales bacterium]
SRLLEWDQRLSNKLRIAIDRKMWRRIAAIFAHSGDSWFWLGGLGFIYWWGNPFWRSRALIYIISILVTAGIVLAIKFSIRRKRPVGEWGEIYRRTDPHSFPSGHAARSILIAVLGIGLGPPWLAFIFLLWAPLVSLARVGLGVHYLSDVLAGMVLGLLIGIACLGMLT